MAEQILPDDLRYVYSPEELAEITELADTTIIEVTTPSTAIPLKTTVAELKEFILSGGTGSGDMLASTYDPTNVAGDAFDMDNMNDGTTNKLVSATEKSNWDAKLDYIIVSFTTVESVVSSSHTITQILAAKAAGKHVIAKADDTFLSTAMTVGVNSVVFYFHYGENIITLIGEIVELVDTWTCLQISYELLSSKVTTWSVTPNDTNYPTEKLVKDSLDDKQDALTFGIANTNSVKIDAADVADNDYAKFTENGLEGKSYAEVLSDIGGQAALGFTPENVANKETSALDTSTSKYPCNNVVNTALGTKVTANAGITAATKTKITYDAKGLVTGGDDATTADIADSTNKRYCTDAEKTVIGNTSNTNTGDQDATDFDIKDLTDSTNLRSTWSGKQDALTFGIANTNALKVDDASAADNEYAKLTANGIEGRSYTEVKQDLDLEIGTDVAAQTHATQHAVGGSDSVFPTDPNADKYLKYNNASNALEWADGGIGDMILATEQSVSGLKTFDSEKLAIKGSSTGVTTFRSENSSALNYDIRFQAKSGIVDFVSASSHIISDTDLDGTGMINCSDKTSIYYNITYTRVQKNITLQQTTQGVVQHLLIKNSLATPINVTFPNYSTYTNYITTSGTLTIAAGGYQLVRYLLQDSILIIDWVADESVGGTGTDEKVKYDASDPTAGYIADKFIAGTGISLAEGTGANENKLVITSTGAGSGGMTKFTLTYYQAKPATCTTGETCFDTTDGKIYTATDTDTWDSGVTASTSVIYIWQQRLYQYITGTTLSPLAKNRKLRKSPTVGSNDFVWDCSGESSKSFVSNNANTTCTVTPVSGDEDTEHSLLFTNSDASASHTISFAAASGFTLKMLATTLTIPASGFVELSVELYGTVCYIKYSIN